MDYCCTCVWVHVSVCEGNHILWFWHDCFSSQDSVNLLEVALVTIYLLGVFLVFLDIVDWKILSLPMVCSLKWWNKILLTGWTYYFCDPLLKWMVTRETTVFLLLITTFLPKINDGFILISILECWFSMWNQAECDALMCGFPLFS